MIYLDHAATGGFKPASVQSAVNAALKACANPGRSGHRLSLALSERVLACRKLLSDLFEGYGYERVVFTKNCTEALNLAISGVLKKGDHVITDCIEHNSVLRPLEQLKRNGVIDYSVAPLTDGKLLPETVAALVTPNTRACCITTASNVTGESPDLSEIRKLLPEHVLLIADGAQGGGHLPLRMKSIGIDALALAGHKGLYAIQGAGALLFSDRVNPAPILFGGTGSESFNLGMPEFYPDALESGTLSYPAIASLYEGALIVKANLERFARHLTELTSALFTAIGALRGYTAYFAPNPCGIASFSREGIPSEELAEILSERFGIAVRGGLHCAPLVHRALGTFPEGLVRASFSPFQSMREVNALVGALKRI
ncbi:MAG: aminotransferase class V-fold PLP-dependent enzyme [Clostridia bacterium]|nr:aminotransferase class V-fold PLP-dependent enzyme [Clostridia bacterium]